MNQEIIPIFSDGGKPSVNARDLHAFLEVGKDFTTWIKDRIQQFGFSEGQDYSPISGNRSDGLPGKGKTEYALSINMAKELSMVERTEKGKQARQYFISCEQMALQQAALATFNIPQTYGAALRLCADLQDTVVEQTAQLAIAAPKVEFYDTCMESDSVCQMAIAAQVAKLPFGRNTLFQKLREIGAFITAGERHNMPYQELVNRGLFTVNQRTIENPKTGAPIVIHTSYATQKGIAWIIKQFGGNAQPERSEP